MVVHFNEIHFLTGFVWTLTVGVVHYAVAVKDTVFLSIVATNRSIDESLRAPLGAVALFQVDLVEFWNFEEKKYFSKSI
jgi:hypothetical protein